MLYLYDEISAPEGFGEAKLPHKFSFPDPGHGEAVAGKGISWRAAALQTSN